MYIEAVKRMLRTFFRSKGRSVNVEVITYHIRLLDSLEMIRNVIAYDNRNGYVVHPEHTPFSYPWGANRYYFNPDAKRLAMNNSRKMTFSEVRAVSHTHKADRVPAILCFDEFALPLDFCDISTGEQLFRDSSQYFYLISKNIEANGRIAREIGEDVFYTDDELFSLVSRMSREKYGCVSLSEATPSMKIEMARIMRYDYNASAKQIMRFLKLPRGVLNSIGIK